MQLNTENSLSPPLKEVPEEEEGGSVTKTNSKIMFSDGITTESKIKFEENGTDSGAVVVSISFGEPDNDENSSI